MSRVVELASRRRSPGDAIRNAVDGADSGIPSPPDGRGGGGPPPGAPGAEEGAACPVVALGHCDGKFVFLDAVGQKRELPARALGSRQELLALFLGNDAWLRWKFPKIAEVAVKDDDGKPVKDEAGNAIKERKVVDFRINDAGAWLIGRCREGGVVGEGLVIRRPGVWGGSGGGVIVHAGDAVFDGTAWREAGFRTGRTIYAAAEPTPRPDSACDSGVAVRLQAGIQSLFRFREPGASVALVGLLGCAYLGAAIQWRPAAFLFGNGGCGKSSLLSVLAAACPLHWYSNDASKAGLEQGLDGRAMPCFVDEAEKAGATREKGSQNLLDLVLTAVGGTGTKGARGGPDGRGRRIEVVSSIVMAATAPPEMRQTHLGRFAVLEMLPPEEGADHSAAHAQLRDWARGHGGALWGRAIGAVERYRAALAAFRAGLSAHGCAPREMDQAGALLAGWWVLTREGVPDAMGVREGIGALAGMVRKVGDVADESDARRLVDFLLGKAVQLARSTDRETVGALLRRVLFLEEEEPGGDMPGLASRTAERVLVLHGLLPVSTRAEHQHHKRMGRGDGIWVNPKSPELARLFADGDWGAGRWVTLLGSLPSAKRATFNVRVGPWSGKALWVGAEDVFLAEEAAWVADG